MIQKQKKVLQPVDLQKEVLQPVDSFDCTVEREEMNEQVVTTQKQKEVLRPVDCFDCFVETILKDWKQVMKLDPTETLIRQSQVQIEDGEY